jgi:BRCA1-associated protein
MSSQHQQQRSTRIRKRPVSFGNPALGTYKGNVYTLDELMAPKPLVEGAEAVERMVAMVDVPPEQVPEGVLNLARYHRPFIDHVRIVIAEAAAPEPEPRTSLTLKTVEESTTSTVAPSPSVSAMENAASILAAESEELESAHRETLERPQHEKQHSLLWPTEHEKPSRTYLVLFHLLSDKDAITFVEDLHGIPFTSLDETVTCSVHHVVALQGEGGVSLLNPMFAPSTKKSYGALEILPSTSSAEEDAHIESNNTNNTNHLGEDPNCAVCLEHMSLDPLAGDKSSILTTVCNHTFHLDCLVQCQDSPCPVCRYDHSGLNETLSQCHVCGTTEHNYVCLICGVVSCVGSTAAAAATRPTEGSEDSCRGTIHPSITGENQESSETAAHRFYTSHAGQHYDETLHAYALDTETQHVWDFAGQGYVHRLLQNKEDGKLVEVNDPNNTTSQERSLTPGLSDAQEGEVVHRKLEGFASQYYTLLKSQLEQQRIFYEGRLQEIRREFAIKQTNANNDKADLIAVLRQERKQLTNRLVSLKRRKEKVTDDVAFLKSMNESLEANKAPLELKIKQAQRESIESREMIQKYLPALEEKVTTLMLQLEESMTTNTLVPGKECAPDTNNLASRR